MKKAKAIKKTINVCSICGCEIDETTQCSKCLEPINDDEDIANKLNIKVVPIIGIGKLNEAVDKTELGFNSEFGNFLAEGIVLRPEIELRRRDGGRIIAKIKHKDFIGGKL